MFCKGFKIVQPKRFEVYVEDIFPSRTEAIVKVETAAVCKADLRYYIGNRDPKVLGLKYPMNLLHEAVGIIVKDETGSFQIGDRVVLMPNLVPDAHDQSTCEICSNPKLGENYCPLALFASSNHNGFTQDYISWPVSNLIKFEETIPFHNAVFAELISVANAAIRRVTIKPDDVIGIWGDGILGYILNAVLKAKHPGKGVVVGHNSDKLQKMGRAETFFAGDTNIKGAQIDIAFECIGGPSSEQGIDEIINVIKPGGKIVLTGVAESDIKINTRKVLEKGLAIYGVTRSSKNDFEQAVELLTEPDFAQAISQLVLAEMDITNITHYYDVFEKEAASRLLGKHVMKFKF